MIERLHLRASEDRDLPRLQAIYAHHVRHGTASFELEPPDVEEMGRRRAAVLERGLPYLVAEAAGQAVAYAYAGPYRPRPAYRFAVEDSVYVDPALIGRGIGVPLLARLIEEATAAGARQMLAVIGDPAQQRPSVRLHEKLGFLPVGTIRNVGWKFGRWLDTAVMQLSLGEGGSRAPD